jgi:hypothetical protein
MAFEQATIGIVRDREFSELWAGIERAFGGDRVEKFLKALRSAGIRARDLDRILAANAIDVAAGSKAGTAQSLYQALPVSDQAQVREFYLSKVEEVDPALRAKFHKVYQYS